ncbi:MAG: hypothetical protein KC476_11085, partial [Cyanobacteria bacterium HKST-UBA06]|nr:hypothetical protein [Cyanobacteria bacterium HKST-UBA06]
MHETGPETGLETVNLETGNLEKRWARWFGWLGWLVVVGGVLVVCWPVWHVYLDVLGNPYVFNNDAAQFLTPFVQLKRFGVAGLDRASHHYLQVFLPTGVQGLYKALLGVADPMLISQILQLLLYTVSIALLVLCGHRLAGKWGGLSAVIMASAYPFWVVKITGSYPRAFAFPFILAGLV